MKNTQLIKVYLLFIGVILAWGVSWPVIKAELVFIPPFWLADIRQLIAFIGLIVYLIVARQFVIPDKSDWPVIFSGGVLFAGAFVGLITLGLMYVHAGRAAILAYTTPFWIALLSYFIFREIPPRLKLIGLLLGLVGIIILFNPTEINWSDHNALLGNGLMLLAALCWSIVILHTRYHRATHTALQLVPWQMFIAFILLGILAMIVEPKPTFIINGESIFLLVFLGLVASAFAYVAAFIVSKNLHPLTTSLGFLGVPVLSVITSAIFLHEKIDLFTAVAMITIILGLVVVVWADYLQNQNLSEEGL